MCNWEGFRHRVCGLMMVRPTTIRHIIVIIFTITANIFFELRVLGIGDDWDTSVICLGYLPMWGWSTTSP